MSADNSKLSAFIDELRRRRVFRVAAFYGGIAFVIVQIIDGTFEVMGIPAWVSRLMIILLAVGFPISMILAWVFDITPEGIVRTEGRSTGKPGTSNRALVAVTILAITFGVWGWMRDGGTAGEVRSIAVLPLANLTGDAEQDYFVDGMHEALTAELSKISALRVIGRTSTMSYKANPKPIPEIAAELNVDAVIEGSVTRDGNLVRITVQLVATRPERHLWVNDYERDMVKILALHKDVARAIAQEIRVTLTPKEKANLEAPRPTVEPDAYQAYLRGRYYAGSPHFSLENWKRVLQSYQQAVELDSNFAMAFAELSRSHARLYYFQHDLSEERIEMAKQAADLAIELAPDSPEVRRILSYYYLWAFRDPDRALRELEIAETGLPHNAEILKAKASIFLLRGRIAEARGAFEEAFEISPRDAAIPFELSTIFWITREHSLSIKAANQAIELAPNEAWPYLGKASNYWSWSGDTEVARAALEAVPTEHEWLPWFWFWQEIYEREYQNAMERLSLLPSEWIKVKMYARPKSLLSAYAYELLNEPQLAHLAYESAKSLLESEVKESPEDPRYHSSLGIVYAALGRKEEAIREGKLAVKLLPVSKDAFYGLPYVQDLAHIYAAVGEIDLALDQIEYLLSIPSWITIPWLQIDPRWDALKKLPRFQNLVEQHRGSN